MSSSFSKGAQPLHRTVPPPPSLVGKLIADKYRLVRVLGHGGMGTVYKAENVAIGKVVAIKLLHRNLADDPVAMQRFQREARATVAIAHPSIVEVLDMGRDGSGAPFLVMEYVRGTNLKKILRANGPLSVERTAWLAGQVVGALAAAHERGIVHRDLKPENILVSSRRSAREVVKVVDFGISTFIDAMAERERQLDLTPTGLTMATPFYASPEQIRGGKGRDPRVDLYAVGVLLYEMLTGHRPFEGENLPALCMRILAGEIAPIAVFRRDVPRAFDKLVRRALATKVHERFQTARELALALVPFGAERPQHDDAEPTDTFALELRTLGADAIGEARGFAVRSALVDALLGYFDRRFGQTTVDAGLARVNGALPTLRVHTACDSGLLARALTQLDTALGSGDKSELAAAGRHAASALQAELPKDAPPELSFSLLATFWQRHFASGKPRVSSVGRGYGRFEVHGEPRRPAALMLALLGLIEESLRRAGGRNVSVRLTACSALGDPFDAYDASWS